VAAPLLCPTFADKPAWEFLFQKPTLDNHQPCFCDILTLPDRNNLVNSFEIKFSFTKCDLADIFTGSLAVFTPQSETGDHESLTFLL